MPVERNWLAESYEGDLGGLAGRGRGRRSEGAWMRRRPYPSDVTDRQWARIEARIPPPRAGRRTVDVREVVNAVLFRVRNACAWRALPQDLPPWQTVHEYYRLWRDDGTWVAIEEALAQLYPA